jgi:hypothetical protein
MRDSHISKTPFCEESGVFIQSIVCGFLSILEKKLLGPRLSANSVLCRSLLHQLLRFTPLAILIKWKRLGWLLGGSVGTLA